jgi:hypothetical protein
LAVAIAAMALAGAGLSAASVTYTPRQVETAFSQYGVPLVAVPRGTFPANTGLSVLLAARSDALKLGFKIAVYQRVSSAEAAYKWVDRHSRATLFGNVLVTGGLSGVRELRDVDQAMYSLSCPNFRILACA